MIAIVLLVGIDQVLKILVRSYLSADSYVELIPNFIHLTYQENQGISFSLLSELPDFIRIPLLTGVSALVILALSVFVYRQRNRLNRWEKWGFTLILAGALGNLIDRAFRQQVTDYMFFHFYQTSFFVNNLADDLISIGFVLMIWQSFVKKEKVDDGKQTDT